MSHFAMFLPGETVDQYADRVSRIYADNFKLCRDQKKLLPAEWKHMDATYWRRELLRALR